MVEHTVRDREVVGSSPTAPTKYGGRDREVMGSSPIIPTRVRTSCLLLRPAHLCLWVLLGRRFTARLPETGFLFTSRLDT